MPAALVDIVVPVYRGERETRACLDSVLASPLATPHEIVVVDDASPEPAIRAWLRELADRGRITLLVHDANRGFVASVNEAMALHRDRDVVLLNSDTEVAAGWLDRLAGCAARDGRVATATPFSNNATICSYPRTLQPNELPEGETTASLDAAFAAANAGLCADITTAVGFCMFIARRALEAVGPFDEARYGAGYGEEVDFCMRVARAGWRNVIAGDVFVRHVGEVSFGGSGTERRARAQATVDALYPEFQVNLRRFLEEDPVRPLRRRADLERIAGSPGPRELRLCAHGSRNVQLRWDREEEEFSLWFAWEDWDGIAAIVEWIGPPGRSRPARPLPPLAPRWLVPPAGPPDPVSGQAARAVEAWERALRPRLL